VYCLRLYVGGASPKSIEAINSITQMCEERLAGRYELQIIDLYQQPTLAAQDRVVAAPMLVKRSPLPMRRFIWTLSNTGQVLRGLGLTG
jgi:circadian clock protein KaiB